MSARPLTTARAPHRGIRVIDTTDGMLLVPWTVHCVRELIRTGTLRTEVLLAQAPGLVRAVARELHLLSVTEQLAGLSPRTVTAFTRRLERARARRRH